MIQCTARASTTTSAEREAPHIGSGPVAPRMTPEQELARTLQLSGTGPRRTRRLKWLLALAAILAAIAFFAGWLALRGRPTVQYRTEEAARGSLTVLVNATGELEPVNQVDVGTEISGVVDTVFVDFNDHVEVGQVLAKVNTDRLEANALQARASIDLAKAALLEAQATVVEARNELERFQRAHELSGGKVPSRNEMDSANATLKRAQAAEARARAQIAEARATLQATESEISKATIRSSIAGIVLDRQVDPGQTVAASFQTPVLFTLAEDLTQMELVVDVDEADVGAVREGQAATFTVDAYPDELFDARIVEVRFAPDTVDGVVTYETVLSVDNDEGRLRAGMTAPAAVIVSRVEDALLVPNTALRFSPPSDSNAEDEDGGGLVSSLIPRPSRRAATNGREGSEESDGLKSVWTLEAEIPVRVDVLTGATDGEKTQVLEGNVRAGMVLLVDYVNLED